MPHFKFDEIAYNITDKKMPEPGDEKLYIGLEHLDTGNLKVTRWGSEVALKGQKLVMKKGDILFGRRNTYLRRAAIAPHDGIFSAHGMIFRPKEEAVDPEYFPFFISSNYFMDAAIRISVGSLSPTVNWKTLKELEFQLPTLQEQRKHAKLLKAINETKEAYQNLLIQTEKLVKAQFIEMFGDPDSNPMAWPKVTFEEISDMITDGEHATPRKSDAGIYLLSARNIRNHELSFEEVDYIDQEEYDRIAKRLVPQAGDVLISCSGTVGRVCTVPENIKFQLVRSVALVRFKENVNPVFMEYQISMPYIQNQIDASKSKTSQANLFQGKIKKLTAIIPSVSLQNKFLDFVKQSDKSKLELQEAIASTDNLMKSILYNNLEAPKESLCCV